MSESFVLVRARARRRPRKPPGRPPLFPWWVSAACFLAMTVTGVSHMLDANYGWAAWDGFWGAVNGHFAIRRWQWDRYDRWKGGGRP